MSAARVRRGASGRTSGRTRKGSRSVTVPKKLAAHLPVEEAEANRLAAWAFGIFMLLLAGAALVALDVPAKAGHALGEAIGNAGFRVRSVDVQGIKRMDPKPVYQIALDQKSTAMPLVDVSGIRDRLLAFGWVKDARVSRRLPDTLVIDIVERLPTALWQEGDRLSLIDAEGVVLDAVPVSQMPDLPLLVGTEANRHSVALEALLAKVPAIKAQLVSANWVGSRRWDLVLQTGETLALPEGDVEAADALVKFARMDKQSGILGRGIVRIDLRIPGKMIVRLPHDSGEPIVSQPQSAG